MFLQYLKKRPSVPKCPMTGLKLKGVTPATNQEKARMSRRQKTVFRFHIVQCSSTCPMAIIINFNV